MPPVTLSEKKWYQVADWFTQTDEQNRRIIELLETIAGTGPAPPPSPPASIEALLKSIDERLIPVSENATRENRGIDTVCLELDLTASTTEDSKANTKERTNQFYDSVAYVILFYNSGCGSGLAKVRLEINGIKILPITPAEENRGKNYIALNDAIQTFPINQDLNDYADIVLYGWNDDAENDHKITCIVGLRTN